MNRRDYRAIMLYKFKLGHSAAEASRNLDSAFGSESPSEQTVRFWYSWFASGDCDLEEKPGRGRRSSLDDKDLKAAVEASLEADTLTLAEHLEVHHKTVMRHLEKIGKVKKC